MSSKTNEEVTAILKRTFALEQSASPGERGDEPIVEAVVLCAAKVQDMTTPDSAHSRLVLRILSEFDVGSRDTLHRVRGVLRAAAQLDGVDAALSSVRASPDRM